MNEILDARYLGDFKIQLLFSDGLEKVFNLTSYLAEKKGSLLQVLQDEAFVKRFFVDAGALCWPNGLELSPERLRSD